MDALNKILSKYLNLKENELKDDVSYNSHPKWDSIGHLKMISEIESALGIEFDIDEITAMENIGKIREIVKNKLNRK
jgi:acyl carrier protein